MKALLIDDSDAIRSMIARILRECNFETCEISDALSALHQMKEFGAIDLIVVDWYMPGLNGLQFITAIRADPLYKDVKILMVTAESEPSKMQAAFKAGVDEYVTKPFKTELIKKKVAELGLFTPAPSTE